MAFLTNADTLAASPAATIFLISSNWVLSSVMVNLVVLAIPFTIPTVSSSSFAFNEPVLQRFTQMVERDVVGGREIGNGAGHADDTVKGAR